MTNDAILARLAAVSHRYGNAVALDRVSLDIPAGGMVGLIGPDGIGKSSVLALLAGARRLQQGRVEVMGHDLGNARQRALVQPRIAYMPQGLGRNLYPTLSVEENVAFFGRLFGLAREERRRQIDELLQATGLAPFRTRPAAKLSGGMKQKLGLCCALIHAPDLLILDEPTTGVDPLSRRQFWELIERIRARRPGMSVIVATAYMEEAERFDWLAAMDDGRILGQGSPAELKTRTAAATLEQAFVRLLPESRRQGHAELRVSPWSGDGEPVIVAEGLVQRFGDFTAVDGVSFRIPRGEIFGFLGSNGCGKTTTMKMLTGLLPPTAGQAALFGRAVRGGDLETRRQVGYMSQSFSLYGELTVAQNLDLHARLFHLPDDRREARIAYLVRRFGLAPYLDARSDALPLGLRQRLSLAVAVVHEPRLLILDEPTSGVDPIARDQFWALLLELSREQGVTIFISTHFMNEAERCDRISLMHAGRVLASDRPEALRQAKAAATLEDAFIAFLEEASSETTPAAAAPGQEPPARPAAAPSQAPRRFSPLRLFGYAYRETLELRRDPIRLAFALLGSVLLMFMLGYGITFDVENLRFAVLDRDQTPESREYVQNVAGSRYFVELPPLADAGALERRMASGDVSLALEIPSGFGRDLRRGRPVSVGAWVDGAMPFRGENIRGYLEGLHLQYLIDQATRRYGVAPHPLPVDLQIRYRYNQDFKSLYAMVPAMIPVLLIFVPALLTALAVVREKELGSITNLYVTPVSRLEFLLGKQLPYVGLAMISYAGLLLQSILVFGVPLKGSLAALTLAALIYVVVTTGFGMLISALTQTQIAALALTAIATMLPSVQFSGLTAPISALDDTAAAIGQCFPVTYFLLISRGVFTKALEFRDVLPQILILSLFVPITLGLSLALLRKQEK
ncbi:multidrug ABC transporter ATP-binding protein [Denitratisoma sp. DHT3]|uniref:ribosome-associated ATPase/putative transporter RbbA n=1 Tax=Denitratisoma sp. DHT3 TaxID=1981880 RepID=UPI0011983F31|nr:ribosome-associated ATPase/putative transporter RbbA [Denitratisoma sp. DHT3]QDX82286.1 multidrug ABC transporter ATP-binding protein [Denitratisoma sp. DHT3]